MSKPTDPEIIEIDYYDGATEGFTSLSIEGYSRCYFKVIAWDEGQYDRLFVVSKVNLGTYNRLVRLLVRGAGEAGAGATWPSTTDWKVEYNADKKKADAIVESCKESLFSSNLLVLGTGINNASAQTYEISDALKREVKKVLESDKPDDLANWLPKLKKTK